ncbi:MAG: lysophospholipid acyltransferase family protein [Myxococcota bacterium]
MLAPLVRLVTGVQDRWVGLDPVDAEGEPIQRVYFANHSSHLDAPVIWAALPPVVRGRTRPVAARDYWDAGFRRVLSERWLHVVLIDRARTEGGPPPSAPMEQALRDGDSLILFPEGTRNLEPDDGLLGFKAGLYHLARAFPQIPFVPVYLANLNRILPKGGRVPVPVIARVTFGAPVPLWPDDDKDRYLARARAALQDLALAEDPG